MNSCKKHIKPAIFLVIVLIFFSCNNPISAELDQEFKLKIGRQAFIEEENLRIFFLSVPEDSRCPVGVTCVWSGNGEVVLELKKDPAERIDTLNTHIDPGSSSFLSYKIILKNLDPYPVEGNPIDSKDYEATIVVEKEPNKTE